MVRAKNDKEERKSAFPAAGAMPAGIFQHPPRDPRRKSHTAAASPPASTVNALQKMFDPFVLNGWRRGRPFLFSNYACSLLDAAHILYCHENDKLTIFPAACSFTFFKK